ncbi:MAG: hypothetical protein ACO1OT_06070 [Heyndrickxia sp.]
MTIEEKSFYWKILQFPIFLILVFTLSACQHQEIKTTPVHKPSTISIFNEVKPLLMDEDSFQKVVGWLDNNSVLYIADENNYTKLFRYNIVNGNKNVVFTSSTPIHNAVISPDKKRLLIHSASSTYLAEIRVIDLNGKVLLSRKVPSYDLNFNWNPENPDYILTTVFFEDWSYQVHILNIKDQTFQKYEIADPFVKWLKGDRILIQDWKDNEMHFFAPLRSYSLSNTKTATTLLTGVYQFDTFSPYLMTITIPEKHQDLAAYHFYNQDLKELFSFKVPHLSQYDNWLVPNYDFIRNQFLTFVPRESGSIEEYNGKYQLIKYDIQKNDKKIIAEELKNQPLSISPDGKMSLYGNQLTQLIDLSNGKIKPIVEYEKRTKNRPFFSSDNK